jgi:TonB family protein
MMRYAGIPDDPRDSMRGAFSAALVLHLSVVAAIALSAWLRGHSEAFGSKDAGGGAVPIEAVNSIPIPHHGEQNPLANESQSEVPQAPLVNPADRVKEEVVKPDAIPIKTKDVKQKKAPVETQHQVFRPYKDLEKNQLTSKNAPQVSSPLFASQPGAGRITTGAHTTLGTRLDWYGGQIQDIVARHWHTGDIDARIQTAPPVIATFELMRDGTVRNVRLLQGSGISTLDNSVQRAILESVFPPIPQGQGFDKDYAKVEFTFELKR